MKTLKLLLLTLIIGFSTTQAATLKTQVVNTNLGTLPRNAVRVPFLTVNLQAQGGDITLNNLVVERSGLSSNNDFGRVWAETSNYKRTSSRRFNNDSLVTLEFKNGLTISEDETSRIVVYANLEFESGGRSASFSLISADHNAEIITPLAPQTRSVTAPSKAAIQVKSPNLYDRIKFRISCKNQRCQLVPRD